MFALKADVAQNAKITAQSTSSSRVFGVLPQTNAGIERALN